MKIILSMAAGALLACVTSFAQKAPIKFGDIPMEDMKMTVYPKDSSAAAVVLADYGTSTIEYSESGGFQINFERIRRIKILTKDGLKFADFSISLYHSGDDEERISGLKVVTYNLENGKIVETKAKSDAFFKERYTENIDLTKVAWANVKEGSVIEISYKIRSDFLANFQDWEFQSTIPTRWSEYRASIPEYFTYQKYMQGYVALSISENSMKSGSLSYTVREQAQSNFSRGKLATETMEYQVQTFRWGVENVPAFKAEPFITTSNDYISKLNFELSYTKFPGEAMKPYMGTWEDINTVYWDAVDDEINGNGSLKDDVATATAGATTDEQKVSQIFDFVRNAVLWDETYRKYPGQSPKKVLDSKKGSSAEINILLASMIEKTKIPVFPVLLSTRDHGFINENIPVSSQFNYVICAVKLGEKFVLLDATTRMLPFGAIPERCLNGQGMLVSAEGFKWTSLKPTMKSRTIFSADMAFANEGALNTTLKIDKTGYHSARARNRYLVIGESEYMKDFLSERQWNISKSEFANVNEIQLPFKETHQLTVNEPATVTDNTIYFNPFIIARQDENPFKSENRQYPVDFVNPFEETYMAKITVPDGYVVDELPPSKIYTLPENAARYTYSLTQNGNVLNLTSSFVINRALFAQTEYVNLRDFYGQVVAKQAEQVVLKKKQ
jgi:hypothetical protein